MKIEIDVVVKIAETWRDRWNNDFKKLDDQFHEAGAAVAEQIANDLRALDKAPEVVLPDKSGGLPALIAARRVGQMATEMLALAKEAGLHVEIKIEPAKANDDPEPWVDPDDAPPLTKDWFEKATRRVNGEIVPKDK
jgi:hypothetical protein